MKKTVLLIAVFAGLLLSVNSCTTAHHCSAYSQIDTNNSDITPNNLSNEEI